MLDEIMERALDDDKNWWPLVRWRPDRREDVTSTRCLELAAAQSLLATALLAVWTIAEGRETTMRFLHALPALVVVLFAGIYALVRFGVARPWNRRARRLRGER